MKKVMLMASKDLCDILRPALDNKYITLPCSDPVAGRAVLDLSPDVLILNLFLPGASGLAFLKAYAPHLPRVIIVLTVHLDDALLQELAMLGVSSVILLPFRLRYLDEYLSVL